MASQANDLIRDIAIRISEPSRVKDLESFDPSIHKQRRWKQIAALVLQMTRSQQERYAAGTERSGPFKELLLLRSTESWISLKSVSVKSSSLQSAIHTYELLLHEDFAVPSGVTAQNRAVARKHSGSFYTPRDLAIASVRTACEAYVETVLGIENFTKTRTLTHREKEQIVRALCTARVIDPTCGVGQFLLSYVGFVCELSTSWLNHGQAREYLEHISENIWGVDVDPIALGLARLAIAESLRNHSAVVKVKWLDKHLLLGNLLLDQRRNELDADTLTAVSSGDIYSSALKYPKELIMGTFDLVLGNPPWDKIRVEEREFLEHLHSEIETGNTKSERNKAIGQLASTAPLVLEYLNKIQDSVSQARASISHNPLFVNSAHGELNTCALFVELSTHLVKPTIGVSALLIKTSTLTHFANRRLFSYLVKRRLLSRVFDFSNASKLFRIDNRERFSLLVLAPKSERLRLAINLRDPIDITSQRGQLLLTYEDLALLNPESGMLPLPKSVAAFALLKKLYSTNTTFSTAYPTARFGRLVHLTMHANEISKRAKEGMIGVLEGKFVDQYDGCYATFDGIPESMRYTNRASGRKMPSPELRGKGEIPLSRFFIHQETWKRLTKNYTEKWSIFWRSTTSASNSRTCIATILPHGPAIQSLQMAQFPGATPNQLALILAIMNSKTFDFAIRNKLAGIDLTQSVINQAPVPLVAYWNDLVAFEGHTEALWRHVVWRVYALLQGDSRLRNFLAELDKPTMRLMQSRDELRREIDDLVSMAYCLTKNESKLVEADFRTR